ncbi:MAG: mobile mystery protein A [Gemmatimonadota bacterium]|nr:mobile mystery protein A [Gemmatimonadota bacterium]
MTQENDPHMRELQRVQLDARFRDMTSLVSPRGGWIRTVRQSLGMTMRQLGKRLGVSPQAVVALERRETDGTISVSRLKAAAEAMGCELKFVFVPAPSLEANLRRQAALKAREERNRLIHTMKLEAQGDGVEATLHEGKAIERWLTTRARELWD